MSKSPNWRRHGSAEMIPMPIAEFAQSLPLLITGITGVAGYNALHYFQKRYPGQVVGTRPVKTWRAASRRLADSWATAPSGLATIVGLDAEDRCGLGELFDIYRFRSVLNAVGNCALK